MKSMIYILKAESIEGGLIMQEHYASRKQLDKAISAGIIDTWFTNPHIYKITAYLTVLSKGTTYLQTFRRRSI
jgi:hypothetical protein